MSKKSSEERFGSRGIWEHLEAMAREQIQQFVQRLLEEEVSELIGRAKSERRPFVGEQHQPVYRNGHGKPRRLALTSGTIEVRRPRLRGLEERLESRVLPLFVRRTEQVAEMLPKLYLHGLAQGDFELALRGLLGDGAPLSASSIERLRGKWVTEHEAWRQRSLAGLEPVYLASRLPSPDSARRERPLRRVPGGHSGRSGHGARLAVQAEPQEWHTW